MKILLADDDRLQTHMIASRLKAKGHKVIVAHDAIQAWMTAIQNLPDAIVLDIQMPGGTGVAVLKQLKTSTKTSQIPIIVLSGSMEPQIAAEMVKGLGADEFLTKPVDLKLLFSSLSRLLGIPLETPHEAA
jgi:two-component system phosphate regulon response regulator PhoB